MENAELAGGSWVSVPVLRAQTPSLWTLLDTMVGGHSEEGKLEFHRKSKVDHVRRNLFGPVDHEQLQQDFQHLLRANIEAAGQKWNYDFGREVPSEGTLEWEELKCHDVPAFYRSRVISIGKHSCGVQEPAVDRRSCELPVPQSEQFKAQLTPEPKRRKQTRITDYYSTKKRYTCPIHHSRKK
ncbi:cyclin-dependent kinase inhibitor 1 isoform X2 [Rhincodon typus]|uniref:cyclin-dependent kinase inhibitor 1 isoform X2 n=1 Tax=Rhincodon typus TaxID=259920 RepID=UPI00202E3E3D|nr:cyclin-dependent kinase inhibitor 1 isoform X2 [Rhincodon typus]